MDFTFTLLMLGKIEDVVFVFLVAVRFYFGGAGKIRKLFPWRRFNNLSFMQ
jgi:hypothetical protein